MGWSRLTLEIVIRLARITPSIVDWDPKYVLEGGRGMAVVMGVCTRWIGEMFVAFVEVE